MCEHNKRPPCNLPHKGIKIEFKMGRAGSFELPEEFKFNEADIWERNNENRITTT